MIIYENEEKRIIQIKEAIELFGLTHSVWRDGCRDGLIPHSPARGRRGFSFTVAAARAFADRWAKENIKGTEGAA